MATIKTTFKRKTKDNYYIRLYVEDGKFCWYIFINNGYITLVRERGYTSNQDGFMWERTANIIPKKIKKLVTEYVYDKYSINVKRLHL